MKSRLPLWSIPFTPAYDRTRPLGPVFERVVGDAWEPHLEKMRAFWSSLVLASGRYKGNPMMAHLMLTAAASDRSTLNAG